MPAYQRLVQARHLLQERARAEGEAEELLRGYEIALGDSLLRLEGNEYVRVVDVLEHAVRSAGSPFKIREAAVASVSGCFRSEVRAILIAALGGDPDWRIRSRAAGALGSLKDVGAVEALVHALDDPAWSVQAAAAAALADIDSPTSVPALIDALETHTGRIRDDLVAALRTRTGRDFGSSAPLWREWWITGSPTSESGTPPRPESEGGAAASRYGIELQSRRVLFLLDGSGSMADLDEVNPRDSAASNFEVARAELCRCLGGLSSDSVFNLATFGLKTTFWKPRPQRANSANRKAAEAWIRGLQPQGGTDLLEALLAGLRLAEAGNTTEKNDQAIDTIVLVSDGFPTFGALCDPEAILEEIRRRNATTNVVIHCVAIGAPMHPSFLRRLASENGGRYVSR